MLFALTRSNLLKQLPDGNGIIPWFTEIVTVGNSIETYFEERLKVLYEGFCTTRYLRDTI